MCANTENYFLCHQCVSNLYKGVLKTFTLLSLCHNLLLTTTLFTHNVNLLFVLFVCVCEPHRHLLANSPLYHSQHHQHALANGATKSHHYHHHQSPSSHSSYSPASSSTGYAYPPFTTTQQQQHPQQQQQQQHPQQQQVILSTPVRIDGEDLFLKPYL